MAYTIQAFIGRAESLAVHGVPETLVRQLTEDLSILPLAEHLPEELEIGVLPLTDGRLDAVPAITRLGTELSKSGRVVYVEAEYFGTGVQASCLFERGKLVKGPILSQQAINEALRFVGVSAKRPADEFDTVQLGRYRSTEEWLSEWVDPDEWRRDT